MSALVARVRQEGTSFYWAIRLLPAERREAMAALYLFCRAVDDIADEPAPEPSKRLALAAWRGWAEGAAPCPDPALSDALADARRRYALPTEPFLAIIDGVAMDLPPGVVAPSRETLRHYCAGVAGAVGLLTVRIFGATPGPAVDAFALTTGEALQFTNILRDLSADAALGRLYLPRETLEDAGVPAGPPAAALAHGGLAAACDAFAAEAEARYAAALVQVRALPPADRRALRPAVVMLALYRALLSRLRRRGWGPEALGHRPPPTSRLAMLGLVLRYRLFDA